MSVTDDPRILFDPEPDSESIQSHSLDEDSQPQSITKSVDDKTGADDKKSEINDDETNSLNLLSTRDTTNDSSSVTEEEKMDVDTAHVNTNDFEKVMDSIEGPPLHDVKLLDFVSNLDEDHPSSQSLDEKLLDSVVEHETPEETMQVERLMESIHNEKSDIDTTLQSTCENTNNEATLTFHKIDKDGQITEHKVLDENDLKTTKELHLDSDEVVLSNTDTPVISDVRSESQPNSKDTKTDDITSENYLAEVSNIVSENTDQTVPPDENTDIPVYDTTVLSSADNPTISEAKDCLQKAMEAINTPSGDESPTQNETSSVEDVLSALHSDIKANKEVKTEEPETKTDSKTVTKSVSSAKRVVKENKDQESPQCFVTGCDSGRTENDEGKRFFKPPPNPLIFKRWARNLCQGSQLLSFNSMICENHFRLGDIREVFVNGKKKWVLNEGALPKINSNKSSFQNFITKKKSDDKKPALVKSSAARKPTPPPLVAEESADSDKKTAAELLSSLTDDIETESVDTSILSYHPNLVKNAQEEVTSLDVLVCGLCHTVFHFFEEFQDHKMNVNCRGTSTFKASLSEPKPQVWAFLLWKNAQTKVIGDVESSWKLYQRWCKMPENLRDTWIAAGKALQDANTLGHLKITDVSSKIGRPKSVADQAEMEEEDVTIDMDVDTLAGGDSMKLQRRGPMRPLKDDRLPKIDISGDKIEEKIEIKKEQPDQLPHPMQEGGTIQEEFVVEKIVSRRFNQKKKQYEYLLKWEGYPPEQNTWEPEENMSTCKHLLKEFEANLAKQQVNKPGIGIPKPATPLSVPTTVTHQKKPEIAPPISINTPVTPAGRPVRSSKQKAMDQVKVWCGSMIKTPDIDFPGKRRLSDLDSEDEDDMAIAKRIKLEQDSEDSDTEIGRRPMKRFAGGRGGKQDNRKARPPMNGIKKESNLAVALGLESSGEESPERSPSTNLNKPVIRNMSSLSPQNQQVLVASAKGVVKVDPTQVPNLTSGVYIMSNKSGIVKLDSVTPSSAISTLQKKGVIKATSGKGGVIMLDNSKPGSVPQKSGIIRKVQATTSPTSSTTSSVVDTSNTTTSTSSLASITVTASAKQLLPKGAFNTSSSSSGSSLKQIASNVTVTQRPSGVLRPLKPGVSPRPTGLLRPTSAPRFASPASGIQPKAPSRGGRTPLGSQIRQRAPLSNLLKSGIKPIESILGTTNTQSTPQKLLLSKKRLSSESEDAKEDDSAPASGIVKINPVKKVFGPNSRTARGGRSAARALGRGNRSSLASLVGMTMDDDDKLGAKEEEDTYIETTGHSSDTDDGIPDDFPLGDLPPIEPDSPPRPLTLCPLTGKVLLKAEGEKTPEPTPPPSPSTEKEKSLLPDEESEGKPGLIKVEAGNQQLNNTTVAASVVSSINSSTITMTEPASSPVTIKRINSNTRGSRRTSVTNSNLLTSGQSSSTTSNTGSTSLGTITVPARKLYHQTVPTTVATTTAVTSNEATENVVTITGEDGLLYQVANADVSGNTLLVSSGEGGQQCVYVTTEAGSDGVEGDETSTSAVLTLDSAYADAVAQLIPEQVELLNGSSGCSQFYVKEGDGGELVSLEESGEEGAVVAAGDDQAGQVVAQLVEAGEPAPGGGPRRVVLLLPDGNLMMTEVDEEQYAALELDK